MTPDLFYAFTGLVLFITGLFGIIALQHLLRKLLAFNLMGSGTFLMLVGLAQHRNGTDPVVQALVLTGIVVAIAATALALVLIRRYYHLAGRVSLERDATDEGRP
ncbi:multicomponent Na+:H+ antiporter subunit C [Marinobacter segnicrescens]|uniref:Multicomponent Na+:H+ antiporter subunit C n=1 Tax=Marinobacter segnicrescens TaxID=430453 RepID=A0A1I0E8T7_9GAMM|nr:cation:proton antiporter subunit C [Marinobacter segnicrescens]SET41602.1 multicomponent Na+:H+ antiporter subunit C [Marinobacter segnicrescens]